MADDDHIANMEKSQISKALQNQITPRHYMVHTYTVCHLNHQQSVTQFFDQLIKVAVTNRSMAQAINQKQKRDSLHDLITTIS
jgi:hypothetical protein